MNVHQYKIVQKSNRFSLLSGRTPLKTKHLFKQIYFHYLYCLINLPRSGSIPREDGPSLMWGLLDNRKQSINAIWSRSGSTESGKDIYSSLFCGVGFIIFIHFPLLVLDSILTSLTLLASCQDNHVQVSKMTFIRSSNWNVFMENLNQKQLSR